MPGSRAAAHNDHRCIQQYLREADKTLGKHHQARLMSLDELYSQTDYRRRPGTYGHKPAVVSPNCQDRLFDITASNVV